MQQNNTMYRRNVAVDFIKIVSMVMVVILHATKYGLENVEIDVFSGHYCIVTVLSAFSIVAVNVFVLISGYYLSDKEVKYSRLFNIWVQTLMYSIGIYLILCLLGHNSGFEFSLSALVKQMLPLLTNQYWFITCYCLMLLVSPILNRVISILNKKEWDRMLITLLVVFSVIPSVNVFGDSFGTNNGYSLLWFCILYLAAAYVKKNPQPNRCYGINYLVITLFYIVVQVGCDYLCQYIAPLEWLGNLMLSYNHILVFVSSICLFQYALNKELDLGNWGNKAISKVSSLSLGVYLLHEHNYMRDILWKRIISFDEMKMNEFEFVLTLLTSVIIIFICGVLMEGIRKFICDSIWNVIQFHKKCKV